MVLFDKPVHFAIAFVYTVYINVKENNVKPEQSDLLKQYIAWSFEQHQKKNPEQMCVVLMDMSGAGASNVVSVTYHFKPFLLPSSAYFSCVFQVNMT